MLILFWVGMVLGYGSPASQRSISMNRLKWEKSPYLLQHADNPVDWYPWGAEAFEKALKEDKPIFLSIGYSTCHWCHVMEQESFEDPEVARLMNETFVSIKVDREERPDIDSVYMTVCQMMTGSGGWPLTIIMTPDKTPFFAATYIPRETRFGRMGMLELIPHIQKAWTTRREEILTIGQQVASALQNLSRETPGKALDETILKLAFEHLSDRFDTVHGGFGDAPKFPTAHPLLFLLRYWKRTGNTKALKMVEKTLQEMRLGGIYDHIGFGFHRYSTDAIWLVPHFEKMLYDQAMLAMAYTEAYQATGQPEYKNTAEEIFHYVLRNMTSPEGAFYSAEDADSEGVEGKFYLWQEEEIRQALGEQANLILTLFSVQKKGNFRQEAHGRPAGLNILHLKKPLPALAADLNLSEKDLQRRAEEARQKLFAIREKRVHPYKDDKILTDWNGLMIAAFARGSLALDEPKYARVAEKAAEFILRTLRRPDGRLLHRYRQGEASILATVDDYAFLTWGLIELYEATFRTHYLQTALDLTQDLLKHFWDEKPGGFYFTPDDGESLLIRQKEIYDGAIPSGNSVAMWNLLRLGRMTANSDMEKKAEELSCAFSTQVIRMPSAYTQLLVALQFAIGPSYEVVIAGPSGSADTEAMLKALRAEFVPNKVVLFRPTDQESPDILRLAEFTKYHTAVDGKATAYVCQNYRCETPTTDIQSMLRFLQPQP